MAFDISSICPGFEFDPAILYAKWRQLVDLLERGASIYDEEVDDLIDSIEYGFRLLLHSADIETQTAMEHPAGSGKE